MTWQDYIIEAVTLLNKRKNTALEITKFEPNGQGLKVFIKFNKATEKNWYYKQYANSYIFSPRWFDPNWMPGTTSGYDFSKAGIPETADDNTKVILKLAYYFWKQYLEICTGK